MWALLPEWRTLDILLEGEGDLLLPYKRYEKFSHKRKTAWRPTFQALTLAQHHAGQKVWASSRQTSLDEKTVPSPSSLDYCEASFCHLPRWPLRGGTNNVTPVQWTFTKDVATWWSKEEVRPPAIKGHCNEPSSNAHSEFRLAMSSTINSDLQSISEWNP